jgi:hypothetical protein
MSSNHVYHKIHGKIQINKKELLIGTLTKYISNLLSCYVYLLHTRLTKSEEPKLKSVLKEVIPV